MKVPTDVPIVVKEIFVGVDKDPFSTQVFKECSRKHSVMQCAVQSTPS